jgi:2-(1,2-epoxy-1,2-dihydrophenyl)acetyl-CoA isomerase
VVAATACWNAQGDGDLSAWRALRGAGGPRAGLVNKVVPRAELDTVVGAIAQSIATGPVQAIRRTKRLVRESLGRTLSEQLQAEAVAFSECSASPDFVEGINAFLAKRAPLYGPK